MVLDTDDATKDPDDLAQKTLRSGEALERAFRSWSTIEPNVARAVEAIHQEPNSIAEMLLRKAGLPKSVSTAQAKPFYWASIGWLMRPFPQKNVLSNAERSEFGKLMTTK